MKDRVYDDGLSTIVFVLALSQCLNEAWHNTSTSHYDYLGISHNVVSRRSYSCLGKNVYLGPFNST